MNQVQSTEETQSDHPGIDNTETSELQINHKIVNPKMMRAKQKTRFQ